MKNDDFVVIHVRSYSVTPTTTKATCGFRQMRSGEKHQIFVEYWYVKGLFWYKNSTYLYVHVLCYALERRQKLN